MTTSSREKTLPSSEFWRGKRVLVTGHTGFKGSWLVVWLKKMGAQVSGISLAPHTSPNLYELAGVDADFQSRILDIREAQPVREAVVDIAPEIVFHLAAQSLVRPSYDEPLQTFDTNVMGTANVLEAIRAVDSVKAVVVVTTDKVYRNLEHAYPYREADALGGHDPYSASKAASEIVIASYRDAFLKDRGVAVASARAGNVIGGGDWSDDRLIPDAVKAWAKSEILSIRRPAATRPWQHVLEPLSGYLVLAENIFRQPELADSYNFGPETHEASTVRTVIELAQKAYPDSQVAWEAGDEGPHEAGWLALEIAKARSALGVNPVWSLEETVARTMSWYAGWQSGADVRQLCELDIQQYEAAR